MSQLLALYVGSLILRSIGIAVIAGICSWKIRNVAMRHAVWVAVLGAVLLMPVVDHFLPASWVPARIQQIAAKQPVSVRVASARPTGAIERTPASMPAASAALPARSYALDWWYVAAGLYALVAFAMAVRLARGYSKIQKLRGTARTITVSVWEEIVASHRTRWRMPVLLESDAVQVPMTVGFIRPAVMLPENWRTWDDWKLRAVLLHETAHVRRCDWAIAAISASSKCAYWLNPVSWVLERKLSQLAEQASDDASLCRTQNATRYAEILLEFAAATQNGGRLIKGGVTMAQQKMKARIERVLGNPQSGTGIVRIAGWVLVMIIAMPVIYSAAALQVASGRTPVAIPDYVAEFGRNPFPQVPTASPQSGPQSAPTVGPPSQPNSLRPADDLRDIDQLEIEKQKLQQRYKSSEQMFEMLRKYNQADRGPIPAPQNETDKTATAEFLREELIRAQDQLRALQLKSEAARQDQQVVNQPNPPETQLEQLKANYEALAGTKAEIARLSQLIEEARLAGSSIEKAESKSRNRIFVTGKVKMAGAYEFDEPLTVLQALALAGGIQEYARMDGITITRMSGNTSTLFRFTYSDVIRGVNTSQNIYLANGDVVVVP